MHSPGYFFAAAALILSNANVFGQANSFPKIYNSQKEEIPFRPATEALSKMKLPQGFKATLFASEPDLQQPIGLTFDSRGRLWVAENYTYAESPVSFDKNLRDRIVILEDKNGDGTADSRKVFWDQANRLTSVLPAFGGVYALCSPQLLFIPDRDGNDIPDGPPEVLLDGFEWERNRHTVANGLKLGPDGWIYGRHGIQGTSFVGKPEASKEQRVEMNVSVWRFHPATKKFEVVAHGTTNPWGADWDENGEPFFINTVIGHLWHAVPGSWFKRMYGEPLNRHAYELIDQVADHVHWDTREAWNDVREGVSSSTMEAGGGHAHTGLLIYQGDNWPASYRGQMFTINFHGRRLNTDRISRSGATYTATHGPDFLTIDDPYFRGIDLLLGPEGAVYLADWSDIGECHDFNGVHRSSGRIYRISYGDPKRSAPTDLTRLNAGELASLNFHPNEWVVRQARQVLQERALEKKDLSAAEKILRAELKGKESRKILRSIWALHVMGKLQPAEITELLAHENEHVRVWAIRLLTDHAAPAGDVLRRFTELAKKDSSGLVLTYLASALQKVPAQDRAELGGALVQRSEFKNDRVYPLMVWYGLEGAAAGSQSSQQVVTLLQQSRLPKVNALLTRRIFNDFSERREVAAAITELLAQDTFGESRAGMLEQILEALETKGKVEAPESWGRVAPQLLRSPDQTTAALALELDAVFGSAESAGQLQKILQDNQAEASRRSRALEILSRVNSPELSQLLKKLVVDQHLGSEAIRTLAKSGTAEVPEFLLARYKELPDAARREVVNSLVERSSYVQPLLNAIHRGVVARKEIGASQLRQLRSFEDPKLKELVSTIWPQATDKAKEEQIARLKTVLTPDRIGKADAAKGRLVYQQSCGVCHKLYGEGAEIGPELTGSDRKSLEYLLENILNPSAVVPDAYRSSTVTLKDDQVLTGVILTRSNESLVMQTLAEKRTIPASNVQEVEHSNQSMMPEGLLDSLDEQQLLNLFAYLMSTSPPPAGK
jgi:putative membrane-bound dehydrogenase-like protein